MMKKQIQIGEYLLLSFIFLFITAYVLKCFNLTWVETNNESTKVTINFLFPMEKENFKKHIQIHSELNDIQHFECGINWLNAHVVELRIKEENEIKGQHIKLTIKNAPSKILGITKSETIPVQFKTEIKLLSPIQEFLISSKRAFVATFNTPISLQQINKYLECEAKFIVMPYEQTNASGEKFWDGTQFLLQPKEALQNGKKYTLCFKTGMRAKSGVYLKQNQYIQLQVDTKPSICKFYPQNGDKWIGLYPRITLESKEDIVDAIAQIDGQTIKGTLVDSRHAFFILNHLLKPETTYDLKCQVQVKSGELSEPTASQFTTTSLDKNRLWLDIKLSAHQIKCYEGTKVIKIIPLQNNIKNMGLYLGTYYLQGKADVFEDAAHHLGGNYWIIISDQLGIQGDLRDSYWQPSNRLSAARNLVIHDEDAAWLYEKIIEDTMIIIRK